LVADKSVNSLRFPTIHFAGQSGRNGTSRSSTGRNGKDIFLRVPLGTIISELDKSSDNQFFDTDEDFLDSDDAITRGDYGCDFTGDADSVDSCNSNNMFMCGSARNGRQVYPIKSTITLDVDKEIALVALGGAAGDGNEVLAGAKHSKQRSLVRANVIHLQLTK
jgi:GTPase involved in cell partitioning and DNA repair